MLAAPRQLVFDAWKDPDGISNWWGPHGFRTTTHEMDFRPGGVWRFTMHGPDSTDYPNRIEYEEIVEAEKLVYSHGGEDEYHDLQFHVTVLFRDADGKTEMTFSQLFPTPEELARVVKDFGAKEGLAQTIERLASHLASRPDRR